MLLGAAAIAVTMPMTQGCWAVLCAGVCLHPQKTAQTVKEVGRRVDPRKRAEDFKGAIEDGSLRDRDFGAYVGFVVSELRLKDVLAYEAKKEGMLEGYRVQTVDGFSGQDGGAVSARLEMEPDYGKLVNEGVKTAFGIWGKLLPDKMVIGIGRDLTSGNRFAGQFLDVGVDEVDLDFFLQPPGQPEILLGTARTDVGGRATLPIAADKLPASGAWPVSARISKSHPPLDFDSKVKVDVEDGGQLFVRRAGDPVRPVVVINVSNTVYRLDGEKALRKAIVDKQYELEDSCTAAALADLSTRYQLVYLSGNPEGMAPMVRDQLRTSGLSTVSTPMVFKPMNIALERDKMRAFKAEALVSQKKFWGSDAIAGYIADDPEDDGVAAQVAGVPYFQLPKQQDGGWCAGIPPLTAARTPKS
jgi:hypothetical protein